MWNARCIQQNKEAAKVSMKKSKNNQQITMSSMKNKLQITMSSMKNELQITMSSMKSKLQIIWGSFFFKCSRNLKNKIKEKITTLKTSIFTLKNN